MSAFEMVALLVLGYAIISAPTVRFRWGLALPLALLSLWATGWAATVWYWAQVPH